MIEFVEPNEVTIDYIVAISKTNPDDVKFVMGEYIVKSLINIGHMSVISDDIYLFKVEATDVGQAVRLAKIYRARYLAFGDKSNLVETLS